MTLIQALIAAVAAETACIVFLFGILMAKNKAQDQRLADCEKDREALHVQLRALQAAVSSMWHELYDREKEKTK